MKNVMAEIKQGISQKTGNPYKQLIFKVQTSQGVYETKPIYPTPLEFSLVEKAISPINGFYEDEEN